MWPCVSCDVLTVDPSLLCEDFVSRFDISVDNDGGLEDDELPPSLSCSLPECDKSSKVNI